MSSAEPSKESLKLAEELFESQPVPSPRSVAEVIDVARALEYAEVSKAGVRAITKAQLEVIGQCIELVRKHNQTGLVTPGMGPRRSIDQAIKMMEAEHARLKGIDGYVPPERKSPIIAPPSAALPKGKIG